MVEIFEYIIVRLGMCEILHSTNETTYYFTYICSYRNVYTYMYTFEARELLLNFIVEKEF